eukprot:12685245-Heterocapsa_arctica.AAC.1
MVYRGGIPTIIAEIALPLFEAGNAQEVEAIANWVALGSRKWALDRARALGFNPMPPDLSLGDSSIMAAVARGEAQPKAFTLPKCQRGQREVHAFDSREVMHNHIPRKINKDADRNASIGADIVTLSKMLRIPQSNIKTIIKLLEGEDAKIGVCLDQEGSIFPWGLRISLNTAILEGTLWRQMLKDNKFISANNNLQYLQFSWEVPTIKGHPAFYASVIMSKRKQESGTILFKAWSETVRQCVIREDGSEPGILVWYTKNINTGAGRNYCKEKSQELRTFPGNCEPYATPQTT